jgi:hypothetical protein
LRFVVTVLLWLFSTAALAVAVPTAWAQTHIVDVNGYTAMARNAAGDKALQAAVASELATRATVLINEHGHSVDPATVHDAAAGYTAGPNFPTQFADANRMAHNWMFTGAGAQTDNGQWVVDLSAMLKDSAFAEMLSNYHVQVPDTVRVPVTATTSKILQPGELRPLATWGLWVSIGLAAVTGFFALLTLVVARSRGRALAGLGISALLVGASGWAAIEFGHRRLGDVLNHTTGDIRSIAEVMVGEAESSLHHWLDLTLAAGGVLVTLGVIAAVLGSLRKS